MTEESKSRQLIKVAETLPYLPDLSFRSGNYWKIYKQAKNFYKKEWRNKEKPSKTFGNKIIYATNYGWTHLVGKTVTTNFADATKRLKHLPNAQQIIEKANFIYETVKEVDKGGKIVNRYSLLGKLEDGTILKVVVKEAGDRLIFVTVYSPAKIKRDSKETQA